MLVLGRKAGERIIVGGDIKITIVAVVGGRVEIGIDAPRAVPVMREELMLVGAGAELAQRVSSDSKDATPCQDSSH